MKSQEMLPWGKGKSGTINKVQSIKSFSSEIKSLLDVLYLSVSKSHSLPYSEIPLPIADFFWPLTCPISYMASILNFNYQNSLKTKHKNPAKKTWLRASFLNIREVLRKLLLRLSHLLKKCLRADSQSGVSK